MSTTDAEIKWLNDRAVTIIQEILTPLGYDVNGFTGEPLFEGLKITRSYPPKNAIGARVRTIGVTLDPVISKAGKTELMISPFLDDSLEVLGCMVHELGHAALGGKVGHGPDFKKYCDDVGLEDGSAGVLDNHAGAALNAKLQKIIDDSEPYPAEGLSLTEAEKLRGAKGATRMVKMICLNTACPGFKSTGKHNVSRATWSNIKTFGCDTCTSCGEIKTAILKKGSVTGGKGNSGTPDPNAPPVVVDGFGNGKPEALPPNVKVATEDENKGNKKAKAEPTESDEDADSTSGEGDDDGEQDDFDPDAEPEFDDFDPDAEPEFDDFDPDAEHKPDEVDGTKSDKHGAGKGSGDNFRYAEPHPADPDCQLGPNKTPCEACAAEIAKVLDAS